MFSLGSTPFPKVRAARDSKKTLYSNHPSETKNKNLTQPKRFKYICLPTPLCLHKRRDSKRRDAFNVRKKRTSGRDIFASTAQKSRNLPTGKGVFVCSFIYIKYRGQGHAKRDLP